MTSGSERWLRRKKRCGRKGQRLRRPHVPPPNISVYILVLDAMSPFLPPMHVERNLYLSFYSTKRSVILTILTTWSWIQQHTIFLSYSLPETRCAQTDITHKRDPWSSIGQSIPASIISNSAVKTPQKRSSLPQNFSKVKTASEDPHTLVLATVWDNPESGRAIIAVSLLSNKLPLKSSCDRKFASSQDRSSAVIWR